MTELAPTRALAELEDPESIRRLTAGYCRLSDRGYSDAGDDPRVKTKGSFPSEDAARKLLFLAIQNAYLKPENIGFSRHFSSGANRDRTGDLLLAKCPSEVVTRCRTLPLAVDRGHLSLP
jgi:hypothetical protein